MKGPARRIVRIAAAAALAAAFVAGAVLTFGAVFLAGNALRLASLPLPWRVGLAAASLVALAVSDFLAIRKGTYSRLSLRRQTPRVLAFRRNILFTAAVWGFDTGLAVTTIRVAAMTWGALALTLFGLASWWTGIGYALGFALPTLLLFSLQTLNDTAFVPKLDAMLKRRAALQALSACLMLAAAATLLVRVTSP